MHSTSTQVLVRRFVAAGFAALCLLALVAGCGRGGVAGPKEYVWVTAPSVNLRDRVAALYKNTGLVKNGDRLLVLDHQKRFVKVRTDSGQEGWMEQRYVIAQDVYDNFQKLNTDGKTLPAQGHGVARSTVNMHDKPARDADHLYILGENEKVELLRRAIAEKPGSARVASTAPSAVRKSAIIKNPKVKTAVKAPEPEATDAPAAVLEDWWMVRDSNQHVGWVLSRMVDLDVPLDVAQYAEGQRIVAAFVLNTVNDPSYEPPADDKSASAATQAKPAGDPHQRHEYLVLLTEPHDGQPFDFNQARVFTWNLRKHRYETAYREHGFYGMLPVKMAREDFGKEGNLPTFTLHVQDESGQLVDRKYKLNTPIVRRIQEPGEAKIKHVTQPKPTAKTRKKH